MPEILLKIKNKTKIKEEKVKKVIITLIIVILVLGIGTGGVLFWGRSNAKTDTAYAQKANNLVKDYESKYSDNYFEKKLNEQLISSAEVLTVKESLEQAKTDAQNDLNALNATKSSKRVASVQKDTQDYFNITIASLDKMIAYMDYLDTLAAATTDLQAVGNLGGEVSSLEGAAAQFDTAKAEVDKVIKQLETASVPDALKDFNAEFKKELINMSQVLGGMSAALRASDMALLGSYTTQMETISKAMATIVSPTDISKSLISSEDQKKLDEIPGELNTEANNFAKKTFTF